MGAYPNSTSTLFPGGTLAGGPMSPLTDGPTPGQASNQNFSFLPSLPNLGNPTPNTTASPSIPNATTAPTGSGAGTSPFSTDVGSGFSAGSTLDPAFTGNLLSFLTSSLQSGGANPYSGALSVDPSQNSLLSAMGRLLSGQNSSLSGSNFLQMLAGGQGPGILNSLAAGQGLGSTNALAQGQGIPSILQTLMSGQGLGTLNQLAAGGGPSGTLQQIAQGLGPGSSALQSNAATGNPVDQTKAWQAAVQAAQRQIDQGATNLKEQFNFAGNLSSTPFANSIQDYYTQSNKDLNSQLLSAQSSALENAANRQLSAGQTLGSQASGASSAIQNSALQGSGLLSQLASGAGSDTLNAMLQGSGLLNNSSLSAALGLGNLSGSTAQNLLSTAGGLGQFVQQQGNQALTNSYQDWLRQQPQYNPLLPAITQLATTSPTYLNQNEGTGLSTVLSALPGIISMLGLGKPNAQTINFNPTISSTGGQGGAGGTGQGGQGGAGGTSTSTAQGGAGGTATANPTVSNAPNISSVFTPTNSNNPLISSQINPTFSPTQTVNPNFAGAISSNINPTIAPVNAPNISPNISPTMQNILNGILGSGGGVPPGMPTGALPPSGLPSGFPGPVSPGGPPAAGGVGGSNSTISFNGQPIAPGPPTGIPAGIQNVNGNPVLVDSGGNPIISLPPSIFNNPIFGPISPGANPDFGGGTISDPFGGGSSPVQLPFDPYIGPGGSPLPVGTGPAGTLTPGDLGGGGNVPNVGGGDNSPTFDPYQGMPFFSGNGGGGGGGGYNDFFSGAGADDSVM